MKNLLACLLVVAACGGGGTNNDMMGDDTPGADASVDSINPGMITINGTATTRGLGSSTPEPGVLVGAYKSSDEATAIATAMTDASGNFTLMVANNGQPLDGFLKATKSGLLTTYLYPPTPITADITAPINMVSSGTLNLAKGICGADQNTTGVGSIGLVVVNGATAQSMPVMGAMISTAPAAMDYCYNSASGIPQAQAMSTAADGLAYALNLAPGVVTVSATKSGSTFKSHPAKVFADALTTTLVTP